MAHHLSVFLENKPGQLEKITRVLADNSISLRAVAVASAGEFGIVKMLVGEPERAQRLLKEARVTVSPRRILIACIDDAPGGLHGLLTTLSAAAINIEDCYGFVLESRKQAAIVLEVEKYPEAEQVLAGRGVQLLSDEEIYSL